MSEQMEVDAILKNDKVQFTGVSKSYPEITFDYKPSLGDAQVYTGLELLLMSLAACSTTTIVALLRRMGMDVSGFKVHAKGIRRDKHPKSFQKIFLDFGLQSEEAEDSHMQKAILLSEKSFCPVWTMLKNEVEIIAGYRIYDGRVS